jgi:hypothetical protein
VSYINDATLHNATHVWCSCEIAHGLLRSKMSTIEKQKAEV